MRCSLLVALGLAASLTACATYGVVGPVTYRSYDQQFQKLPLQWSGTYQGKTTDIYLKWGKQGSQIGICGFYIESSGMEEDLTAEWLKNAYFVLDGTKVVSSSFLPPQESLEGAIATCVTTKMKYEPDMKHKHLSLAGPPARLYY
ncbi:hypothetical protein [Sneathiella sp.]|uniref:hypothetical protein n=1 Tax=Sneathiella sp. TaxID=1964365 RepID=UPI0035690300